MLEFCLGQSKISTSAQTEGADGLGQRALDPGPFAVSVAPCVGCLLSADILQGFMEGTRTQRDLAWVGFGSGTEGAAGTGGASFTMKPDVDGVVSLYSTPPSSPTPQNSRRAVLDVATCASSRSSTRPKRPCPMVMANPARRYRCRASSRSSRGSGKPPIVASTSTSSRAHNPHGRPRARPLGAGRSLIDYLAPIERLVSVSLKIRVKCCHKGSAPPSSPLLAM